LLLRLDEDEGTPPTHTRANAPRMSLFKEDRTACINRIRGMLAEFSLVFGKSPKVLRAALPDVLEDASNGLDGRAQRVLNRQFDHWRALDEEMRWPELQPWQGQPGAHHQARRRLPANAAHPRRQVRRHERGQAR
jgi:hypothetical protein